MKTNHLCTFELSSVSSKCCVIPLLIFICSCQGPRYLKNQNLIENRASINIGQSPKDSIIVHYIGCSGFFIQKGNNTILIDPYFSYKLVLRKELLSTENIRPSLKGIIDNIFTHAIGTNNDNKGSINALLISHAHVDHLGDVPYLYQSGHLNANIKVIGNTTAGHYLRPYGIKGANINDTVEASATSWLGNGKWISINKNVKVLPIIS